ncbi:hypothetical protein HK102_005749, partial [Quaeritorhiza haematococci]
MTCNSCVRSIESQLCQTIGVTTSSVSLSEEVATVSYDSSLITPSQIAQTIEDCGFDASLLSSPSSLSPSSTAFPAPSLTLTPAKTPSHQPPTLPSNATPTLIDFGDDDVLSSNQQQQSSSSPRRHVSLSVKGMVCKSCVNTITNVLTELKGVISAHVELETESADVEYDGGLVTKEAIMEAVEDCGFEVSLVASTDEEHHVQSTGVATSMISVKGMVCQSCVNTITKAVSTLPGVSTVTVSLEKELATIHHDTTLISIEDLINAIEECGFDAHQFNNNTTPIFAAPAVPPSAPPSSTRKPSLGALAIATTTDTKKAAVQVFGGNPPSTWFGPLRSASGLPHSASKEDVPLQNINSTTSSSGTRVVTLEVHGMTCASCVASIEKHLNGTPGITACKVALLAERAEVRFNPSVISDPQQVADLINDVGFEACVLPDEADNAGVVDLRIFGMTCASCSGKIEREVSKVPGVRSVSVNLLGQSGRFEYDKDKIGVRDIVEKIEGLGFNALLAELGSNAQIESLERTREIQAWRSTFFKSLAYSLPVSLISMIGPMIAPGIVEAQIMPGLSLGNLAMMLLTIPVQFGIGKRFYVAAYKALSHGTATMDVLITLGTTIGFVFSCIALLYSMCHHAHPEPSVFFETSATLITFITLGRYLENVAKGKTSSALSKLISLAPTNAVLLKVDPATGGMTERTIPSEYIQRGDLLKVVPGERIPADGTVEFGRSTVDESLVTGEPIPVSKKKGDTVIGGTVNGAGMFHMRATKVGSDTTLSQIIKLVNEAQTSKAPIQAIADTVAGYFVPAVIGLGLFTFFAWLILLSCMPESVLSDKSTLLGRMFHKDASIFFVALNFCISVIVVACPCALGLATPTAVMVGTGVGARHGILIKGGGAALETAHKVSAIAFDKTGTLTMGKPSVSDSLVFISDDNTSISPSTTSPTIENTPSTTTTTSPSSSTSTSNAQSQLKILHDNHALESVDDVLKLVGCVEGGSDHPLARAIVGFVLEKVGGGSTSTSTSNVDGGANGRVSGVSDGEGEVERGLLNGVVGTKGYQVTKIEEKSGRGVVASLEYVPHGDDVEDSGSSGTTWPLYEV